MTAPFAFALLQGDMISLPVALFGACLVVVVSIGANWLAGTKSHGRFIGTIEQRFEQVDDNFVRLEKVNEDQWTKINEQGRDLGKVRERMVRVETKVGIPSNGTLQ